jgi:hypothetical protein
MLGFRDLSAKLSGVGRASNFYPANIFSLRNDEKKIKARALHYLAQTP